MKRPVESLKTWATQGEGRGPRKALASLSPKMKHSPRTWNVLLGLGRMRMGVSQPRKTEMISPGKITIS